MGKTSKRTKEKQRSNGLLNKSNDGWYVRRILVPYRIRILNPYPFFLNSDKQNTNQPLQPFLSRLSPSPGIKAQVAMAKTEKEPKKGEGNATQSRGVG